MAQIPPNSTQIQASLYVTLADEALGYSSAKVTKCVTFISADLHAAGTIAFGSFPLKHDIVRNVADYVICGKIVLHMQHYFLMATTRLAQSLCCNRLFGWRVQR